MPFDQPKRLAATLAGLAIGAAAAPALAQDSLLPLVGASRHSEGAETYVFQCLLGGVDGRGGFVGYEEAAPRMQASAPIRWVDLAGVEGTGTSNPPVPMDIPCEYAYVSDAGPAPAGIGGYVGVPGDWNPLPAALALHSPQSQTYSAAALDYFASIAHPTTQATLTQVIRTDLEGDGVDEVLITVKDDSDGWPTTIHPGDHSAILLRRLRGGTVETVVVDGEFYDAYYEFAAPTEFEVLAVADLNGDGVAEIFARADYYEGSSFTVYQLVGGQPVLALSCGCGS
ncbi:MAG: hypothetical protein R3F55_04570 [Alphaproteobacteria bacterium]